MDNEELRSLTFERERDLVDNLALLSADTDDPDKVRAVCVEEHLNPVGLTVVLAVNKGTMAHVKAGFEKMFEVLERAATQSKYQRRFWQRVLKCMYRQIQGVREGSSR